MHRFIDSGRDAGRGRKQRQKASESLGRQNRVGTRPLGYKRRPALIRGFAQQDPVFLHEIVSSQAVHGSSQWLDNTEEQIKPSFKWLNDNLRNLNRRTCPKTNEKDRQKPPLPINVTGYMLVEKGNFL